MKALAGAWYCQVCPETGAGTPDEVDKAAERHTKKLSHSTVTSLHPMKRPTEPEEAEA